MATIGELNVRIGAEISDFEAKMAKVQSGIGRIGDAAKSAGQSLSTFVTLPLALLAGASIAALAKIDGLTRGLNAISTIDLGKQGVTGVEAVGQAAAATSERLKLLQEIAKAPGIGFEQAVQGDIRLRAVGIAAFQSAAVLKEFANAIALTGGGAGKLDEVTVQLAQLSAKGKVLAQDLRPVIEAAPAVATALQKLYGTVDSETISKSLEKQGKSSKDFIATLTTELGKLPRVTGGIGNSLDNFAQGATQSLAKLGAALNKAFNVDENINRLSDLLTGLADSFSSLDPALQKLIFGFGVVAAVAGPLLIGLGAIAAALPSVVAGFELVGLTSAAAFGPVGIAVAALAAAALLIISNWDALVQYFTFGDGGTVFANLAESVKNAVAQIAGALASLGGGESLGGLVSAGRVLQDLIKDVAAGFTALADVVGGTIGAITKLLQGDFAGALDQAKRALLGVVDPLANVLGFSRVNAKTIDQFFGLTAQLIAFDVAAGEGAVQGGDLAAQVEKVGKKAELTKKQLKALEDQIKAMRDLDKGFDSQGSRTTKGLRPQDAPEFIELAKPLGAALPTTLKPLDDAAYQASLRKSIAATKAFNAEYGAATAIAVGINEQFTGLMQAGAAQAADALGTALGGILGGTLSLADGLSAAFQGVLGAMAGFIIDFGKMLIQQATLTIAATTLANNPLTAPLAIGLGIAAIAVGTALKGLSGSGPFGGGGGGGGAGGGSGLASSPRTSFTPTVAPNAANGPGGPTTIIHNVVFDLQGNRLLAAIDIETDRLGRVTGRR